VGDRTAWRIQNAAGRGPYIPGFSHRWADVGRVPYPPWWEELELTVNEAIVMLPHDTYTGCAFQSLDHLRRWFSRRELSKLGKLGFYAVCFNPDQIVAETPTQIVFANREPHHTLGPPAIRFAA